MLRSFDQLRETARPDLLIAANSEYAAVVGGGDYAMPWHWHDCLMFILPSRGTIELRHEGLGHGQWGAWLQAEVSMSQTTATNFMRVAREFGPRSASVALSLLCVAIAVWAFPSDLRLKDL
jgi:hypothetical protein